MLAYALNNVSYQCKSEIVTLILRDRSVQISRNLGQVLRSISTIEK